MGERKCRLLRSERRSIRWLVDDCVKFVEREIRRGNHYDAIIMDAAFLRTRTKGRDLEGLKFHSPFHQAVYQYFIRQSFVLPGKFLYHRAGARSFNLYAGYGTEILEWYRRISGNRAACHNHRAGTALRRFRPLEAKQAFGKDCAYPESTV